MRKRFLLCLAAMVLLVSACNRQPLHPLDGASTDDKGSIVRLREGTMLLRGLDGKVWDATKIPNPFSDFLYAFTPGQHTLWAMNIQGGHPLLLESLRCYVIENVELKAGVVYRLNEDKTVARAVLVREDTGAEVASGKLVDTKSAYTETCNWKQQEIVKIR